jgi:3-dehydrosphinganine reductase
MVKPYQLALITGGSSGIGLALAKKLVQSGTDICILARDAAKLENAKSELAQLRSAQNQQVYTLQADVTDYAVLEKSLSQFVSAHGWPDLVINSAGVTYPGYFQELDVDIFHWLMEINYYGTVHILKILTPGMIERGSGTILNISSQAGFVGVFGYSGYSASKYAVRGFSDVIRSELKPLGIQVSVAFPPDTETPQLAFEEPLKPYETRFIAGTTKVQTADAVADVILKAMGKGKYIIIPGSDGKLVYRALNLIGNLVYPLMDTMVRTAQKKKAKQEAQIQKTS